MEVGRVLVLRFHVLLLLLVNASSWDVSDYRAVNAVWPTTGNRSFTEIIETFGPRTQGSTYFSRGISIPCVNGSSIYAVADGTLISIRSEEFTIKHNTSGLLFYTIYKFFFPDNLSEGSPVGKGQQIGLCDGTSALPLLYFELRNDSVLAPFAIHPLVLLPWHKASYFKFFVLEFNEEAPGNYSVSVRAQMRADQLYLQKIELALVLGDDINKKSITLKQDTDAGRDIQPPFFDLHSMLAQYTHLPSGWPNTFDDCYYKSQHKPSYDEDVHVGRRTFNGHTIVEASFDPALTDSYNLTVLIRFLADDPNTSSIKDVSGKLTATATAVLPSSSGKPFAVTSGFSWTVTYPVTVIPTSSPPIPPTLIPTLNPPIPTTSIPTLSPTSIPTSVSPTSIPTSVPTYAPPNTTSQPISTPTLNPTPVPSTATLSPTATTGTPTTTTSSPTTVPEAAEISIQTNILIVVLVAVGLCLLFVICVFGMYLRRRSINRSLHPTLDADEPLITMNPADEMGTFILWESFSDIVCVAKGKFGSVSRAYCRDSHEVVALKENRSGSDCDFYAEIQLLCSFRQKDIVQFYGWTESKAGVTYMVTEFCENGSLASIGFPESLKYFMKLSGISNAISYIHNRAMCHLDISARNLVIDSNRHLKLADMGLMRKIGDCLPSCLPVAWCPPEAVADGTADTCYDVWSFGCTAYEVLVGNHPFYEVPGNGTSRLREIACKLTKGQKPFVNYNGHPDVDLLSTADDLILKRCWQVNPEKRITVPELIDLFRNLAPHFDSFGNKIEPSLRSTMNLPDVDFDALAAECKLIEAPFGRVETEYLIYDTQPSSSVGLGGLEEGGGAMLSSGHYAVCDPDRKIVDVSDHIYGTYNDNVVC